MSIIRASLRSSWRGEGKAREGVFATEGKRSYSSGLVAVGREGEV